MQEWMTRFAAGLRRQHAALPAGAEPSPELADRLLALARIVADGTGQKTNAPLTCYLVGYFACLLAEEDITADSAVARATEIADRILKPEA